eukprot:1138839-Pelagomonas_calceolata.AAC.2
MRKIYIKQRQIRGGNTALMSNKQGTKRRSRCEAAGGSGCQARSAEADVRQQGWMSGSRSGCEAAEEEKA